MGKYNGFVAKKKNYYIIQKRIEYITLEKRILNQEQKQLKAKLKVWKSMNS